MALPLRVFRRLWRIPALLLWAIGHGVYSLPFRYLYEEKRSIRRMARQIRIWAAGICWILGIRARIHGDPKLYEKTGGLVVSNHLGYADIFLHASVFGLRFTPKADIRKWPVLGWYADMTRPIWVDRKSKQSSARTMVLFRETLLNKIPLIIYPEGTSTDGKSGILPFKTTPFEPVVGTDIPVQPIVVVYRVPRGGVDPAWYGDMTFLPHLWDLLGASGVTADIYLLPQIRAEGRTRKELAQFVHDEMLKVYDAHLNNP